MQTSTKICKYQVTTTLKMSIGYLQILPPVFRTFYRRMFTCPRRIYFSTQNLLSDAEMGEDIVEGLLGGNLSAGDVG